MALMGLDIAWARPSNADILSTGACFVARYLSPDDTKNLTAAEVQGYPPDGISIVVVWESTEQRMLDGYAAGAADAQAAENQLKAVGLPDSMPIYFACDFDVQGGQLSTINDYMRGVNSVIGLGRSGFYGSYYAVENVAAAPATATYFWQADAWSDSKWSGHANIRQDGGTALGGSADIDHAMTDDYGQYPRFVAAPVPAPLPAPTTSLGDDEMAVFSEGPLPEGFASDIKGNEIDHSKARVISLPPKNSGSAGWGGVWLSFACDFATVRLRVAICNAAGQFRINFFDFTPGKRVSVPIFDGDQYVSVGRVQGFGDGAEPVGYLIEAVKK
ncbi:DUF1906 domain-containing protein [Kitasatospora acidiphila]|uniref:DUF1906 domain-containing protein n=1 Tax=Kitasatospora acidiphila TaxID=2567942 RepID=A0A540W4K3_9ACTN|nr:glycoside hydrolase domain-containing protein [Kitasatospora acidiphila]TQF03940.1 DUF1906 domain-containing protein [Kitasatospora acidiphila]